MNIVELSRIAFDPRTSEDAALSALREIRSLPLTWTAKVIEIADYRDTQRSKWTETQFEDLTVPFGRHTGKRLSWILKWDRNYLEWISKEAKDPTVRAQAKRCLLANP